MWEIIGIAAIVAAAVAAGVGLWLKLSPSTQEKDDRDYKRFLEAHDLTEEAEGRNENKAVLAAWKRTPLKIALAEWSHQQRAGSRAKRGYFVAQVVAPVAAATATVLAAFKSTSAWAVLPAAVATVTASLLAAFGLQQVWLERRRLRHQLSLAINDFAMGYGTFREAPPKEGSQDWRVDKLMAKVAEVSEKASDDTT